jgi:hypothetical protein
MEEMSLVRGRDGRLNGEAANSLQFACSIVPAHHDDLWPELHVVTVGLLVKFK